MLIVIQSRLVLGYPLLNMLIESVSGADGVIIGSAFVKRISNSSEKDVVDHVGEFCKDMRLAADQKKYK